MKLKIRSEYFEAVVAGRKKAEMRFMPDGLESWYILLQEVKADEHGVYNYTGLSLGIQVTDDTDLGKLDQSLKGWRLISFEPDYKTFYNEAK